MLKELLELLMKIATLKRKCAIEVYYDGDRFTWTVNKLMNLTADEFPAGSSKERSSHKIVGPCGRLKEHCPAVANDPLAKACATCKAKKAG